MASMPAKDDNRTLDIVRMARLSIRPLERDGNEGLNNRLGTTFPRYLSEGTIGHLAASFSLKRHPEASERIDHRLPEEMALQTVHGSGSLALVSPAFPSPAETTEAFSNMAMFLNIAR